MPFFFEMSWPQWGGQARKKVNHTRVLLLANGCISTASPITAITPITPITLSPLDSNFVPTLEKPSTPSTPSTVSHLDSNFGCPRRHSPHHKPYGEPTSSFSKNPRVKDLGAQAHPPIYFAN